MAPLIPAVGGVRERCKSPFCICRRLFILSYISHFVVVSSLIFRRFNSVMTLGLCTIKLASNARHTQRIYYTGPSVKRCTYVMVGGSTCSCYYVCNVWQADRVSDTHDRYYNLGLFTSPGRDAKYIVMSTCMSVCRSVRTHNSNTTRPNFTNVYASCPWPWLGPPPTALRYVVHFRFCG